MRTALKYIALLLCAAAVFSFICGCSGERMPEYYENAYNTGSDVLSVRLAYDTGEKDEKGKKVYFTDNQLNDIFSQCCDLFDDAMKLTDHTDVSAGIYAVNQQVNAAFDCDWKLTDLLQRTYTLADSTEGYYQPVFGSVLRLLEGNSHPERSALDEALAHTGTDKITVEKTSVHKADPQAQVDLTGVQKGYALEEIIAYLNESAVVYGYVTLNGSAGVFGTKASEKPFEIGIAGDTEDAALQGYVQAASGYVFVASQALGGGIDPHTGETTKSDLSKVVVLAQDAVAADGLADALYTMGSEAGQALYSGGDKSFEAIFFLNDGTVKLTDGAYRTGVYHPVTEDTKEK